jgi:glyoxylase-like metal-dependent hydrolase (beta-lactamase superfamily II)
MPGLRRRRPRYEARGDSDPELEMVEPMIDLLFKHGLRPAYIIDTHTHADHVSGARDLKCKTIAKLVMHEEAPSGAIDIRVKDGDRLALGDLSLKFLHTPGHVKDLVSILLPGRILTADALLIGSCGRTDLLNGHAVRQYHTLYYTYKSLPDELEGWPGYDYKGRSSSTLGDEKRDNPKMLFGSSVHLDSPPTTKAGVPALDFRVSGLPRKAPKNGFVW